MLYSISQFDRKSRQFHSDGSDFRLKKEVLFCGTKSGRDFNKFKECNLKTANSKCVDSPVIDIPGYHFECKILYKTAMDPKFLDSTYNDTLYSDKDYHTLYFAEIAACYKTE